MEPLDSFHYQTIRDWEGKIRKITQKEYTSSVGHGQYYPAEGCMMYQEHSSDVVYFTGGARHTKPAHWNMSDIMFKVRLSKLSDGNCYAVESFDILNPSESQTSVAPKLAFASCLTVQATKSKMVGFSVNGKCLDLRSVDMSLTNEIHVYETVHPLHTTYRTRTFRTPERAEMVKINSKSKEVLQQGDIPPPMYGSTLTLKDPVNKRSGEAVMVGGNSLVKVQATPMQVMTGAKSVWEEESNGQIYSLKFDLSCQKFVWGKKKIDILPRAHHSAMIAGNLLYIFGGLNCVTRVRYDVRPVIVNMESWTTVIAVIPESFPDMPLSGHSFSQISDTQCIFFGGYNQLRGDKNDSACDKMLRMVLKQEKVISLDVRSLGCGPLAQASIVRTPKEDVFIIAGGIQERWALVSQTVAPAAPCSLDDIKKCIMVNNPDLYPQDTVNWLGCSGPCKRWFHVPCVHLSHDDYVNVIKRKKWFCHRADCN